MTDHSIAKPHHKHSPVVAGVNLRIQRVDGSRDSHGEFTDAIHSIFRIYAEWPG